jgi:ATP-dependent protease HslVU (ClpYQ) peptidase subunit
VLGSAEGVETRRNWGIARVSTPFHPLPYTWPMTTLIAFQGPNFAILGADSQVTDGDKRIISPSTPKIVKLKKYLLAVSGDCRPGDVLTYNWTPPAYDGTNPVTFMGKKIIPSIIAAFKLQGFDYTKEGISYSYLLAFAGNIFEIGDDLSITQSADGLYGVGSGSAYALGALAGQLPYIDKAKILSALAISAKYDINTAAPFQIEIQRV